MPKQRIAKLYSAELDGINAELIEVEADINVGLHAFNIVGLADKAVSEAKERVNSALKNSGIKPPTKENRRITINLAPANVKKAGSRFDLAIALAYLIASEQIKNFETKDKFFVGELSLDGSLRPINGVLSVALLARKNKIKEVFVPKANAKEASVFEEVKIIPVSNLIELIDHLEKRSLISPASKTLIEPSFSKSLIHLEEIKGQVAAKRALLIAASGGHNLLLSGPPGTGKTMLAQALVSVLPPPSLEESVEITQIYSAVSLNEGGDFINYRPFRSPHHSASLVSIVGGGTNPKPGEISLAHRGVLFLDEIPEFHRDVLESLRQPLEMGSVQVARAKKSISFPARFQLIAAMNPCRCGYFGDREKECRCTANEIFNYQKKLSGPLLDRLDIQLEVPRIGIEELRTKHNEGIEEDYRKKVVKARLVQEKRFKNINPKIYTNSQMTSKIVDELIVLDKAGEKLLKMILEKNFVSARGFYRTLKVARTIADLEESENVNKNHLAEAFQYRLKTNE